MQNHEKSAPTLKSLAYTGVRWTTVSSVGRTVIQVLQVAVLARLMAPAEFGKFAAAFAVISVLRMFADGGVSNAVIHIRELSRNQLSSLYWLNCACGLVVAGLALAAAPLAVASFGETDMGPLLAMGAAYLFLGSTWQLLRTLSEKRLRFSTLAVVEILAAAAGFAASIVIAMHGGGAFALMGGLLAGAAVSAGFAWIWLRAGWRPIFRFRTEDIRPFASFGGYTMASDLIGTLNTQIDLLLGGRLLGAQNLGFYSATKNLCLQLIATTNPIVTRVGIPVIATSQSNRPQIRLIYLKTLSMTAGVNFPAFVAIGLFAEPIVSLVFGEGWSQAVPMLGVFAVWALLRSMINPVGSLLMGCGRADLAFRWNLAWLPVYALAFLLAAQPGGLALAGTQCALAVVALPLSWYFLVRPLCDARLGEYVGTFVVPLVLSLIAGILARLAASWFTHPVTQLAIGIPTGFAVYALLCARFNRAWLLEVRDLVMPRRPSSEQIGAIPR